MVSHELRNPLSAIVQSSEVVLSSLRGILKVSSDSTTAPELRDDVETMKSIGLCTMHMRRLIDDTINVRFLMHVANIRFRNSRAECCK
jgi:signal transduction histidine kinase